MYTTETRASGLTPRAVFDELGATPDVMNAIIRAERKGHATAGGAEIEFSGYQDGAEFCHSGTGLYKVRW